MKKISVLLFMIIVMLIAVKVNANDLAVTATHFSTFQVVSEAEAVTTPTATETPAAAASGGGGCFIK